MPWRRDRLADRVSRPSCDGADNPTSVIDAGGQVTYGYNAGRLLTDPDGSHTSFSYASTTAERSPPTRTATSSR
jgi:YD repeat-containing protein